MKFFIVLFVLVTALLVETTFFSLPFVLLAILFLAVIFKERWIFFVAFFAGIFLDMLSFRTSGISSLFFTLMLGIVFLYERKFEIQSIPFLFFFSFLSVLVYGFLFSSAHIFLGAFFSGCLVAGIFFLLSRIVASTNSNTNTFFTNSI